MCYPAESTYLLIKVALIPALAEDLCDSICFNSNIVSNSLKSSLLVISSASLWHSYKIDIKKNMSIIQ